MSMFDAIAAESHRGPRCCSFTTVRTDLEPADQADLDRAMDDASLTGAAIARVLTRAGHAISGNTVARHRRGECSCA